MDLADHERERERAMVGFNLLNAPELTKADHGGGGGGGRPTYRVRIGMGLKIDGTDRQTDRQYSNAN